MGLMFDRSLTTDLLGASALLFEFVPNQSRLAVLTLAVATAR